MRCCVVCKTETDDVLQCAAAYAGRVRLTSNKMIRDEFGNLNCNVNVCQSCGQLPSCINDFIVDRDDWVFCPDHRQEIKDGYIDFVSESLKTDTAIRDELAARLTKRHKK